MKNFLVAIGAIAPIASPAVAQEQCAKQAPKLAYMKDGKMVREMMQHSKMGHATMDHGTIAPAKIGHA